MLTLIVLAVVLVLLAASVLRGRRQREAAEEEHRRREETMRRSGSAQGAGGDPFRLHTQRMPTVGADLEALAAKTEGLSPADLKSLAQEAALAAMAHDGADLDSPSVAHEDFTEALSRLRPKLAPVSGPV